MLILIVPKIPNLMMTRQGKGRRTAAPKVSSITGQAMVEEASVKQMVTWTLWLIPTHRTMASDARVGQEIVVGHPTLTQTA